MEKRVCGFCETSLEGRADHVRWCSPQCLNRGNQLRYLLKLKERAKSNPTEFHGRYRQVSEAAK